MLHPKPVPKASGTMDEPDDSSGYATSESSSKHFWRNGRTRRFPRQCHIRNQFHKLLVQWTNQKVRQAMPHPKPVQSF
jgi:hypothetical protein